MSEDMGSVAAGLIFLTVFAIVIYPLVQIINIADLPKDELLAALGVSWGEFVIIALMLGIVFVWSFCQFGVFLCGKIIDIIVWICQNEKLRNFSNAVGRKANNTIGRKARMIVRDIYRDMRDHDSL